MTQTCTNYNYTSNRWKYQKEIFVFFNWKNARWLNNFDLNWNKMLFTDLGSPFDNTHMCIYAHVFSKGFCICLKLFPLINLWIFEKLLLLFQGRDYETDEESEKMNEKDELSTEQWVSVYPCVLYHHMEEWAGTCTDSFIPTTPEISFCFIHRSMWIYFIGHVYTWKTEVCVNGWFMQRGYRNGIFFLEKSNSIHGKIIAEKLWAKVSPLCTIIATDVPERMTIKAPQTNQNHLQYDIILFC